MIRAAHAWPSNAELIADVADLYIDDDAMVVDVTYGKGTFWNVYTPKNLVAHDLDPAKGDGVDWGNLPEQDNSVDVLVFDPPYVSPGGRKTSTLGDMNERFAMQMTAANPAGQWDRIVPGLEEAARVLVPKKGLLLFKCMNYVWAGKLQRPKVWADRELERLGFRVEDEFIFIGTPGPQPTLNKDGTKRRQVHARNNASYLIVARKL